MQLPYDPAVILLDVNPENEDLYAQKKPVHKCLYSSFIHNDPKLETDELQWMNG